MESERTLVKEQRPRNETSAEADTARPFPAHPPAAQITARRAPIAATRRAPSELVLGRYRLLERLGSGGFGVVWSAQDELLGRAVAVKRIWLGPDGDRERATREAQATARLSHPAIVALYEACVVEGAFYLISELVHGETLARLIAAGELEDEEVLEIGLALAGALAHAHARGVIHRDIKPHNVLVPHHLQDSDEAAKLTDFGGASLIGEEALTRTGDVLGTLAYMAPEQSEGAAVDEQADLYAFALVLYEALSGVNPVRGPTPAATARRIGRPLPSLARSRPDLPRDLIEGLDDALAPAPAERGSLDALHAVLEDTLEQGLAPRRRRRFARPRSALGAPARELPTRQAPPHEASEASRRPFARRRSPVAPSPPSAAVDRPLLPPPDAIVQERAGRLTLPRALWIALALLAFAWQAWAGRAGAGLLVLAALAPLIVAPAEPRSARVGAGWLVCSLAPVLGLAGLASAYPALAGQASRWRERLVHGALGYWWLTLAGPLLGRKLWLDAPVGTPARAVWESSITATAGHVIAPALTLGVALGALLWGCGACALPLLVRGRSAALDVLGAIAWSGAIAAATPVLAAALAAHASQPLPRGLLLGAILAALIAVAARALRGPV